MISAAAAVWLATRVGTEPAFVSEWLPAQVLMGIGVGLGFATIVAVCVRDLGPAQLGIGSGMSATTRQLGAVLGVAILIAILGPAPDAGAYDAGWWAMAALALAARRPDRALIGGWPVAAAIRRPRSRRGRGPELAEGEAAAVAGADAERRDAAARSPQRVLGRLDGGEAERLDAAVDGVVEQPEQAPVAGREQRLRARPRRRRRDEPDVLARLEDAEQLVAEGAADRGREPGAAAAGRLRRPHACGRGLLVALHPLRRAQQVVGGVDLRHPPLRAAAVGMPCALASRR